MDLSSDKHKSNMDFLTRPNVTKFEILLNSRESPEVESPTYK